MSLNNSGYAIFAIYSGANPEPKGEVPMVELIIKTFFSDTAFTFFHPGLLIILLYNSFAAPVPVTFSPSIPFVSETNFTITSGFFSNIHSSLILGYATDSPPVNELTFA